MDIFVNQAYRQICAVRNWYFLEGTATALTVASQQAYSLPYDYDKLIDVYITSGSYKYTPVEVVSQPDWDRLNEQASYTSNYPVWFHIYNNQINFWPIPSTSNLVITYNYRKNVVDLSIADDTTGTITATNGSASVVGAGTSWNSSMVGRFIRITPTTTAATNGDGFWYKISAVGSTTTMTLSVVYGGTSVAGATLTIGQMPILPEAFHDMPVYKAVEQYYSTIEPELDRAQMFKMMYDERFQGLVMDSKKTTNTHLVLTPLQFPQSPNNFINF